VSGLETITQTEKYVDIRFKVGALPQPAEDLHKLLILL